MSYDYNSHVQGVDSQLDIQSDKRTVRFIEAIQDLKSPRVLEVGVGQGRFMKKVLRFKSDVEVYGIDISSTAIKNIIQSGLKGNFKIGLAEKIPYTDEMFDVVVIADVIEHLEDPLKAINEISRVLKPKGVFHFYVPCENQPLTFDWLFRKLNITKNFTFKQFGHIQFFTHADIFRLIHKKFRVVNTTYSDHLLTQICYLLVLWLPNVLLGLFIPDKKELVRDAAIVKSKKVPFLKLAKYIWLVFFSYPASIVAELEAKVLKNISYTAKGLHVTAIKRSQP